MSDLTIKPPDALKSIYEDGLVIYRSNGLINLVERIPKSHDDGFNESLSWNQFVKQGWQHDNYKPWWNKLMKFFGSNNLNYNRFEIKITAHDPMVADLTPAMIFKRAIDEIERMVVNSEYYSSYVSINRDPTKFSEISLEKGTIAQNITHHKFHDDNSRTLLEFLWKYREILNTDKSTQKEGKVFTFDEITETTKIKINGIIASSATINKGARENRISLRISFPRRKKGDSIRSLKLVARQDTSANK